MATLWVFVMGKWSYWDRGYTNVGTQKIWSVQDSQCNVIVSLIRRWWCLDGEMIATVWICLGPKIDYHCTLTAVIQVSMFEWRGGYRQGAKFEFLACIWTNSTPLRLENCSNLIKYPCLCSKIPQFGAKFVVKISERVNNGSVHMPHICPYLPLCLTIETCVILWQTFQGRNLHEAWCI